MFSPVRVMTMSYQSVNYEAAEFLAQPAYRASGTIVKQHGADAAGDRERREPWIGRFKHASSDSFFDERSEKDETAFSPRRDEPVARLGQARLFGREQAQQIAALVIELDADIDGVSQAGDDVVARLAAALI